jgi:hypothetical protein
MSESAESHLENDSLLPASEDEICHEPKNLAQHDPPSLTLDMACGSGVTS